MKLSTTTQTQAEAKYYVEKIIDEFGFLTNQNETKGAKPTIDGIRLYKDEFGLLIDFSFEKNIISFRAANYDNGGEPDYKVSIFYNLVPDSQIRWLYGLVCSMYREAATKLKAKLRKRNKKTSPK